MWQAAASYIRQFCGLPTDWPVLILLATPQDQDPVISKISYVADLGCCGQQARLFDTKWSIQSSSIDGTGSTGEDNQ